MSVGASLEKLTLNTAVHNIRHGVLAPDPVRVAAACMPVRLRRLPCRPGAASMLRTPTYVQLLPAQLCCEVHHARKKTRRWNHDWLAVDRGLNLLLRGAMSRV
ncbi:hypothetical protein FKP32DRAFT_1305377 [Trametes sanguinea]|nr:hypothetical protein FKP32DRAFT_1305377 [Trametes sanguinea]